MKLSRRRFFSLLSASCLVAPAVAQAASQAASQVHQWRGTVLGANAQIILDHPDASKITARALSEISRLENIFSLYRENSEIVQLNSTGHLDTPSFELLECLSIAQQVHQLSDGLFDPTVQMMWRALAEAHSSDQAVESAALDSARRTIGFNKVSFGSEGVELAKGQQLTLNGIAQGYIADRVALLLKAEGVRDTLINTGEIVAMGVAKGQDAWPVTIVGEDKARALLNRALCTSAPLGTVLDSEGTVSHIINPREGSVQQSNIHQVSVSDSRASVADALSTALCVVQSVPEAENIMRRFKSARLESIQTRSHT